MRPSLVPSSPPSVEGTAPTPSSYATVSTPNTALNDSEKKAKKTSGDDLAAALVGLTINNSSRNDDPFLMVPSLKTPGLSPTAKAFTPGETSKSAPVGSCGAFSSSSRQPKRAILVQQSSAFGSMDNIAARMSQLLKRDSLIPLSIESPSRVGSIEQCLVHFDDVRDAQKAFEIALDNIENVDVYFLDPKAVSQFRGFPIANTSIYDDELIVSIMWNEYAHPLGTCDVEQTLVSMIASAFDVPKACILIDNQQPHCRKFRMEFFKISTTLDALAQRALENKIFRIEFDRFEAPFHGPITPISVTQDTSWIHSSAGQAIIASDCHARSDAFACREPTSQVRHPGRRSNRNNDILNKINIQAIQRGVDVRTTVMLRNIPNRINCHELKALMDETSFGCYDFMYLRIDFDNGANVGYAFINFVTPEDIIPFAIARQGRRWIWTPNSNKEAEISYATIQGRENLIAKFRNSSVMFENPDFIPKLFTPVTGAPEAFPAPDNLWKMKRSMENAETVGLYRPSRGRASHFRPPQSMRHRAGYYGSPARATGHGRSTTFTPPSSPSDLSPTGRTQVISRRGRRDFGPIGHPQSFSPTFSKLPSIGVSHTFNYPTRNHYSFGR